MVASYCDVIKDGQGRVIGAINTSLSLSWLSQTVSSLKPYPNSYSIMISRGGTYFVHPDTSKITRQTIFTHTFEQPDTALTRLGHAMQRGEDSMMHTTIGGVSSYVFYQPLGATGCSIAIVCPESDIFSGFDRLRRAVTSIVAVGLLLMLYFFIRIITRELNPLRRLAKEAETIASGQFDAKLPDFKRIDEIGQLTHSFGNMQQSLVRYIDELKETTSQKASIERDLRIASAIQKGMLPEKFPSKADCDDVQIYASLTPAKEVGGDLFDFYFRDEKLFFCIGDVSGKGVPAALVMAVTRAQFRTVSAHESMPERIITRLNDTMSEGNDSNMFVTLFVGVLDLPTGRLRYCNAGHDSPLLIGSGIGMLPCDSNLPVGVMGDWKFTMQETQIDPGTSIFLYTDGLTEAENIKHDQFTEERILDVAKESLATNNHNPHRLVENMTNAVKDFVNGAEQSDDLTMLAIQYTKQQLDVRYQRSITLANDVQQVPQLAEFIDHVCEAMGFDELTTMQMNLAIEEAVVNVMNYAYPEGTTGSVNVEVQANDVRLKFVISDSGKHFDPTSVAEADTTLSAEDRSIGGLGIYLVRQLMDSVNYERIGGFNVLTLRKKLHK